jgi:dTDP-4-amino-4,6-dideoxygalactose transaminase
MNVEIPLLDLQAQNGPLRDEVRRAFDRVASSNRFILGEEVEHFERELASELGVAHAIGVSSGTDALLVALMALGVGPDAEVITTPFSFFATAGCIARLGARPIFVDVDPETLNLDPAGVEAHIGPRTKALLPVHLYGQPCAMAPLIEIARRHALLIVEDAARYVRRALHGDMTPGHENMDIFGR